MKEDLQEEAIEGSTILVRLRAGEPIRLDDPEYKTINAIVNNTIRISQKLNSAGDIDQVRNHLSAIVGHPIAASTVIFPPFHTNFGRFIRLGKDVFINHGCSFLDMGGITLADDVLIGPKVNLITENHPLDPDDRRALLTKPIHVKRRAWIGAAATILPGVTIGENAVVAAGSVVNKDVPDNVLVAGVPARIIKYIDKNGY